MTLIKSISGIRGTIGGSPGEGLTPIDIVKFSAAFGMWVKNRFPSKKTTIVIGRDARISGKMVRNLCVSTLSGLGINVLELLANCWILSLRTLVFSYLFKYGDVL